jgi:hypothetical protein
VPQLRARLPGSKLGWVLALAWIPAWVAILWTIYYVLAPTLTDTSTIGQHDWDQMEAHRQLVDKTILHYHQFPFWEPYACGGHPNWGGFESGSMIVSPWLPFYLTMTLPHAMRVEIWGSALISAVGAWLLAGRFTRSPALRALVVVVFAVDGRWGLQIATGHTWHLAYAWMPWALYFYDRAVGADPTRGVPRLRDFVLAGASIAMMVYTGGIYPLPETIFVIALYGSLLAAMQRSFRPVLVGLGCGLLALGLAAPKLLPVLEVMLKHPRLVESDETLDLNALIDVLTSRDQDVTSGHAGVSQWGWHEWGMYVGWAAIVLIILGAALARGTREWALRAVGAFCFVLGLGSFHRYAPWPLLRHVPVFQSQHVPSRWMYPGLLLLLVVTAAALEAGLHRSGWLRGWLEVAALAGMAWIARDVARVARQPITHMFLTKMPTVIDSFGPFHTEQHLPGPLNYEASWAPLSLPAIIANIGTTDCGTFPALHSYFRDWNGNTPGLGARGEGDPRYQGEAYIPDGTGRAELASFTPNQMTVVVHDARPGEHVVLNQNYDAGWSANGSRAINWADAVAAPISSPEQTFVFRYRPVTWWPGLALFVATVAGIVWITVRSRRAVRAS